MEHIPGLHRVAFLGNYQPHQCGLATFTTDVCESVASAFPETQALAVAMNDRSEGYAYPARVRFEIPQPELDAYHRAADFLNTNEVEVLCVQHEYGIYGGDCGEHVLEMLREVRMPIVTTLHTILTDPSATQRRVMMELAELSDRLVTMTKKGVQLLKDVYHLPAHKIDLIPHGIPDMAFVDPNFYKDKFGVEGKTTLLTFGLLSPGKGIEHVIEAMPDILAKHPNVVYIVLGATHPHVLKHEGEAYRERLKARAAELGVKEAVRFFNQFVSLEDLKEFIGSADIYITPYLNAAQITSGTLAYSFGAGKAVISTPYWHAEELLAEDRGSLVPFSNPGAIAAAVDEMLTNEAHRHCMRKNAYNLSRGMVWSETAKLYMKSFRRACAERARQPRDRFVQGQLAMQAETRISPLKPEGITRRSAVRQGVALFGTGMALTEVARGASIMEGVGGAVAKPGSQPRRSVPALDTLPALRLEHLKTLSDSTGMFQHAIFNVPNFAEGYTTDDNARAFILTTLLDELGEAQSRTIETGSLGSTYLAFLWHAFNPQTCRFRNFMSFDRRWLEEAGSEDSHGRALWALGTALGRSRDDGHRGLAGRLFSRALPITTSFTSPRAWAFTILAIHEYLRRFSGDREANRVRDTLTAKLVDIYTRCHGENWQWFEDIITYDNAQLPHALILSGQWTNRPETTEMGLQALRWLLEVQTSPESGCFSPIGSNGFYKRGERPAHFDQQPLEANAMVSACLEAYRVTRDEYWVDKAQVAFEWFVGRNDLGLPLYDATTGACRDGLHANRVNQNMGAESTLAALLSLTEMKMARLAAVEVEQRDEHAA